MIEIVINGVTIPLPPKTNIVQEKETTLLNRDNDTADFTFPVNVPLTDAAIVALGFPNSLANPSLKKEYIADYIEDGIYIDRVTVKILRVSFKTKVASISIIGSYGSFARVAGSKKLADLVQGGTRTFGTTDSAITESYNYRSDTSTIKTVNYKGAATAFNHIKSVTKGDLITDYFFGTAIDQAANIDEIHVEGWIDATDDDGATLDYVNVINAWDYIYDVPIDPIHQFLDQIHKSTVMYGERFFWVPFFRMTYVLRNCFEELGFKVTGNFLSDVRVTKVGLYNTYALNSAKVTTTGTNIILIENKSYTINPQNHMPDMTIVDFVLDIARNYNLQYGIDMKNMTVNIRMFEDGTASLPIIDLSSKVLPLPEIVNEAEDFNKGYKFTFQYDGDDSASGEGVEAESTLITVKTTVKDIAAREALTGITINDIVFVQSDLTYYKRTTSTTWTAVTVIKATVRDVAARDALAGTVVDDIVFVMQDLTYYKKDVDGEWVIITREGINYRSRLDVDDQIEIKSKAIPMLNDLTWLHIVQSDGTIKKFQSWPVVSNIGIAGNNMLYFDVNRFVKPWPIPDANTLYSTISVDKIMMQPHMINWQGKQSLPDTPLKCPTVSSYPYSSMGTTVADTTALTWHTTNNKGLYDVFWNKFVIDLSSGVTVEWEVLLDALTASTLDLNNQRFLIDGLLYLCRKASIVKPLPAVSKLTLVRI